MRCQGVLRSIVGLGVAMGASGTLGWSQGGGTQAEPQAASQFLAPATQVVAVRAGRLFDVTSGTLLTNQVVLIRGDRIADVGPAVEIPPEASVIDLSGATVLPGMIDTHVHVNGGGPTGYSRAYGSVANAQKDVHAGFTTGGKTSRLRMAEQSFRKALAAGVPLPLGAVPRRQQFRTASRPTSLPGW